MGGAGPSNEPVRVEDRWRIEAEHYDREFAVPAAFDPASFYRSRPWGVRRMLDRAGEVSGRRVLDVGSGVGLYARYYTWKRAKVVALDVSHRALVGLGRAADLSPVQAPAERLPLRDRSVDCILGAAVLHHVELRLAAPEFRRVLRRGGRCVFYEPLAYNPLINLFRILTPERRTPTERPLEWRDLDELRRAFARVDLEFCHLISLLPQAANAVLSMLRLPGKRFYRWAQPVETALAPLDRFLFNFAPAVRRWAQSVVIECR